MKKDGTVNIFLNRLIENAMINFEKGFCWDNNYVTLNDIEESIKNGNVGTNEPYGDTWKYPAEQKDKQYHIDRVVYFVNNPNEIKDIEIDNDCDNGCIYPNAIIVDGWHRLLAAKYINTNKIQVQYSGRMDVLNYLTGKRKTAPYDIL